LKPRKQDRSVLIVVYIGHEEFNGQHPSRRVPA
jgi:hypothetical protein